MDSKRFYLRENNRSQKLYVSERVPNRSSDVVRFSYPMDARELAENAVVVLNTMYEIWTKVKSDAPSKAATA